MLIYRCGGSRFGNKKYEVFIKNKLSISIPNSFSIGGGAKYKLISLKVLVKCHLDPGLNHPGIPIPGFPTNLLLLYVL